MATKKQKIMLRTKIFYFCKDWKDQRRTRISTLQVLQKKICAATVAQMEVGRQLTVWDGGRWRRPTWWSATRTQRRRRHGGGLGWQSLSIQTFWQKEHWAWPNWLLYVKEHEMAIVWEKSSMSLTGRLFKRQIVCNLAWRCFDNQ